jgi:signal transduction histidine kinase
MLDSTRGAADAWLGTLTVLYVEDEPTTRELLSRFLRRRVGRLVEAANGVEGLALFRAEKPALVITDIEMPELNGLAMATEIRRLDADVPIVVVTAFEDVDYLRRAIDAGIDKYVNKPVEVAKLETALRACAEGLRARAVLAREQQQEAERQRAHEREAIALLAGGMAHDYNNLLQGVLGNVDYAASLAPAGSELAEVLADASASGQEAVALGHTLNTLSNDIFGRLQLGPLGPMLSRALSDCGLTLCLELPADLPPVAHDADLLGRAFAQVALNAGEAMGGAGALTVTADVRALSEDEVPPLAAGRYVQLTFRDEGPGIGPDVLPRVFDPYFSTKPRGAIRGMGLGLATCRAIVGRHGGLITAASPPGGGAAITVLLPID